ncbi:ComEC/Rec2 family competence protein [Aerococcaceae bacterium WGS1372]
MLIKPIGFEWAMNLLNIVIRWFNQWNDSTELVHFFKLTIGYLDVPIFIGLIITAILFITFISNSWYKAYLTTTIVYVFFILCLPYLDMANSVTVIDVDQGDAILYSLPFNQGHWLIDTGGRANWASEQESVIDDQFAKKNILPALKSLGVNQLEGVILTHPDIDHIGNLVSLSQEVHINELWMSQYTFNSEIINEIKGNIKVGTIKVLNSGEEYNLKDGLIRIFSMDKQSMAYSSSESNDRSLIVYLQLGNLNFLSLGDISKEIEVQMINDYKHLEPDIIKLAHHGSDTSTSRELLSYYQPKLAVNSAGVDNRYGHPHASVVESLKEFQIPLLSTHESGAIRISYHRLWGYRVETVIQ